MRVAVPTRLAGAGGGMPGGHQGGVGDSVPLPRVAGKRKAEGLAWHLVPGYIWIF